MMQVQIAYSLHMGIAQIDQTPPHQQISNPTAARGTLCAKSQMRAGFALSCHQLTLPQQLHRAKLMVRIFGQALLNCSTSSFDPRDYVLFDGATQVLSQLL